ncbi:hypothetical protein OS493_039149 [Desmophyllum pertusum]|uniref:Secreted protein n=1 Tax=Desmophyllum pertusum TaxID=174260 RepID=A0A9X0CDE6_9CNID|nr:hypothetical protein OS493_039149 [Desmophyllum pertusum]
MHSSIFLIVLWTSMQWTTAHACCNCDSDKVYRSCHEIQDFKPGAPVCVHAQTIICNKPSNYLSSSPYEDSGVAVDWRSKAISITHPDRIMPNKFFFLTELHLEAVAVTHPATAGRSMAFMATAIGLR